MREDGRMPGIRVVLAVLIAVALAAVLAPGGSAGAVGETCHGVPATIVGAPDLHELQGTDGADVIVSNGADQVFAGAGDDLVCTTESEPWDFLSMVAVRVEAGTGNDIVDTTTDGLITTSTNLDEGDDTFLGGFSRDGVSDGAGNDAISTGPGKDSAGSSGGTDTVDLGIGDDSLIVSELVSPTSSLTGGYGVDVLNAYFEGTGDWLFDNLGEQATRDGVLQYAWSGFETFRLADGSANGHTSFLGSAADESVSMGFGIGQLRLGGGDDEVYLYGAGRPAVDGIVSGGAGHDLVHIASGAIRLFRVVHVSLPRGTLRVTTDAGRAASELALPGFEDAIAEARTLRLVGDRGPNRLTWTGCRVRVLAGGGDDTVLWDEAGDQDGCPAAAHQNLITGNGGSDHLVGSRYDDVLVGGDGIDHANGKHGRDRCSAEVVRKCEVSVP
jgi:hypothetical protein